MRSVLGRHLGWPLSLAALTVFVVGSAANAAFVGTVNVDIGDANNNANGTATTGPGAVGAAGDQWTTVNGSNFSGMPTADGTPTDVQFFLAGSQGGGQGGFGWGNPGDNLRQDYAFIRDDNAATVTLPNGEEAGVVRRFTIFTNTGGPTLQGDLDPRIEYDLHMLAGGDNATQGGNFLLKQSDGAGGFIYLDGKNPGRAYDGTYVAGENYTPFTGVSPTAWGSGYEFELFLYWTDPDDISDDGIVNGTSNGGGNMFAAINGFQVVSSAPEPSALILSCLALVSGLGMRRRG